MTEKFDLTVQNSNTNLRLDKFLTQELEPIKPELTRSKIQTLISENNVYDKAGKSITNPSQKVKEGQIFTVEIPEPKPSHLLPKQIDFEIIFEDDDLLVINKPAGLTVHPGAGNQDNTLVNGLLFTHQNNLSQINGDFRPGIVHRLDKDTSGLMLVAKNDLTHQILSQKLQNHEIKRSYLAFIYGKMSKNQGKIDKNIIRHRFNRLKMTISKNSGRSAITHYEVKETFQDGFASLVECRLETGRTHQIRVHFESEKHSLIGDQTYGSCRKNPPKELNETAQNFIQNFPRQALHSYKINFLHPKNNEEMSFEIPLPEDLKELQEVLENG